MFEPKTSSYNSRYEFEKNVWLIAELMNAGRFQISERSTGDALHNVRVLPNGRINLHTIDERVRSMMHMVPAMTRHTKDREDEI